MLIDIHTHASMCSGFLRYNGSRYPTPEELIEKMDSENIDMAVVLCSVSPEVRYVLVTPFEVMEMARRYPKRFIPFCSIDPRMMLNNVSSDFRPMLNYFKESGFKGIGEYMPNLELDHPLNMNLFSQVEEVGGLPILFHLANTLNHNMQYGCYDDLGLPRLEKVLKSFPKQIFLAHSQVFWAEMSSDITEEERGGYPAGKVIEGRVSELMRKYPNLHSDLSAGSGHNAIARDLDFGLNFMEEFQDRLYFGTDIANVPQDLPQIKLFKRLKEEKLISEEAYEKISWQNAVRLFGIKNSLSVCERG
jgi:predicted TIM-barrel fold metal-dependent hydrolase